MVGTVVMCSNGGRDSDSSGRSSSSGRNGDRGSDSGQK